MGQTLLHTCKDNSSHMSHVHTRIHVCNRFHNLLHNWFIANDFSTNPHEPCLYQKWIDNVPLFCLVWVDDCTIVSKPELVKELLERIQKVLNVKDLGPLGLNPDGSPSILLGMEILRTPDEFQLRQSNLVGTLIAKAGTELNSVPHEKVPIRDVRLKPSDDSDRSEWKKKPFRSYLGIIGFLVLATHVECALHTKNWLDLMRRILDHIGKRCSD